MNRNHRFRKVLAAASIAATFLAPVVQAQVVELSPGYIAGEVSVSTDDIAAMWITAQSGDFTAEQYYAPGTTPAAYNLTVQVEEGTTRDYSVRARISTGSQMDMTLQNRVVTVSPGQTTNLDFSVPEPTIVEASVDTINGDIGSWRVYAYEVGGDGDTATRYQNLAVGSTDAAMSFPMGVSEQVRCIGYVWRRNGAQTMLPSQTVTVVDGIAPCDWSVEFPATGSMSGTVEFSGDRPVGRYSLNVYGTTNRWIPLSAPFSGPENLTAYSVSELDVGSYYFSGSYAQFYGAYSHLFYFPDAAFSPSRGGIIVNADNDTRVDVHSCQAFTDGLFLPSGSTSIDDVAYGEIRYRAGYYPGSLALGGWSRNQFDSSSGAFEGILSEGHWYSIPETYVVYSRPSSDPDGYLSQNITVYPGTYLQNRYFELNCGDVYPLDHEMPTGRVTVNFSTSDDTVFSYPRVSYGYCDYFDPDTGDRIYRYTLSSTTSGVEFVDIGESSVTLEAPDGICYGLKAQAYVNGTLTTFAELDGLEFDSGVTVVQDIGGPSLSPEYPEPDLIVDASEITVYGVVTDDVDVAFLTVNGVEASLTSTGNPDDPVEMEFSATVPLPNKGANELTYYAEDGSGKSTETSYVIYNDSGVPLVGLAPANGLVTSEMLMDIEVSASDDAGIASLTLSVDGTQILSLDGQGELAVSASEPFNFSLGTHTLVVVATDISNRMTTRTHQIEIIDNSPPVVSTEGPWEVDEGGTAILSAIATDPDGDALTIDWDLDGDGEYDDANGLQVIFDASLLDGDSSFEVSVKAIDDGGLVDSGTDVVTVNNVAPVAAVVSVPVDPVALGTEVMVSVNFEDAGIPDSHTLTWYWDDGSSSAAVITEDNGQGVATGGHHYPAPGIYRISCVLRDDDGGETTCESDAYVVVFDPDGGFVTGGGYIQSPPGAVSADPALEGKAHFGFVAKYKKGQSTPVGQTEFQFKAGGLNFHSSSYEWLVVAGHRAQFKGVGTINGDSGYGFMITAIDGKLTPSSDDAFRIRIWNLDNETSVYDNKHGSDDQSEDLTTLQSGSIVIHKK